MDKYCFLGYKPNESIFNETLKHSFIKKYDKNSIIIRQGETNNKKLYLLLKGKVKIFRISEDGEEMVFGYYTKRVFFGESAFSDLPRYVSVEAMTKVEVAVLESIAYLKPVIREELLLELFKTHANKFQGLMELNEELRTKRLRTRLLNILVTLSKEASKITYNNSIYAIIKITHDELADIVCANRVTVSNELSKMQEDGLLRLHRGTIDLKLNNLSKCDVKVIKIV